MIEIVSFGYLHAVAPAAHLTIDLRSHFRDPHVSPEMRNLTARDNRVRDAVLATPGIAALVEATAHAVAAFTAGPSAGPVTVASGCAGGRHRGPVFADLLANWLRAVGQQVTVHHRDLDKPVVHR